MAPSPNEAPLGTARSQLGKLIFHLLWIGILLVAAWRRWAFPIPMIDHDFSGFLGPALFAVLGHEFHQVNAREFLYPGFIYLLLKFAGSFRAIALVQHLLGLASGVLILASWCRVSSFLRTYSISKPVYYGIGLVIFGCYLLTPSPIQFECLIRPDTLCPFFAALTLFFLVSFVTARAANPDSKAVYVWAGLTIFVAFLLPFLKPSYWLTSILCTLPIWAFEFDRRRQRWSRLALAGTSILAIALLLIWPEHRWSHTDTTASSASFLPESLFSIHALIIRDQIADDIAHPGSVPYSPEKLTETLGLLDAGIAQARKESPTHFKSLGYDADYLLYRDPFFNVLSIDRASGVDANLRFCRFYYWRTWQKRPIPMLGKVASQLGIFYGIACPAYPGKTQDFAKTVAVSRQIIAETPNLKKNLEALPMGRNYLQSLDVAVGKPPKKKTSPVLWVLDGLKYTYTLVFILYILALPWALTGERRAHFGGIALVLACGYAFNLGNNLGIAIMHTLEVARYTHIQLVTTIFTQALALVFEFEIAVSLARKRSAKASSPQDQEHSFTS